MLLVVVAIVLLFVGVLALKAAVGVRLCALCTAVAGTWIGLLSLYHAGHYGNETVVALLMGQSVVGLVYALRDRVPERYEVFALPSLLAGTVLGYALLVLEPPVSAAGVVTATWVLAGMLYAYREDERVETAFEQVVACCRDW